MNALVGAVVSLAMCTELNSPQIRFYQRRSRELKEDVLAHILRGGMVYLTYPTTAHVHKYRIDHAKEWVMRLYNPRVCGYPDAKPRDKCKQVGYSA